MVESVSQGRSGLRGASGGFGVATDGKYVAFVQDVALLVGHAVFQFVPVVWCLGGVYARG